MSPPQAHMGAANRLAARADSSSGEMPLLDASPPMLTSSRMSLYQLQLGGLGLDGLQQVLGAHRLNELHPAHYLPAPCWSEGGR